MRLAVLALIALLLAGCATPTPEAPAPGPAAGGSGSPGIAPVGEPTRLDAGPAWSFTAFDGSTQTRDSPDSNATVIFFMATWCGVCRSKAPVITEVAAEYEAKGVRILSLDFDPTESEEAVRTWQESYDQPWPHGLDKGQTIQRLFGVTQQSSVVVLDGDGNLVKLFGYGKATAAGLRSELDPLLAA